jgi:hypothetical protein
MMWILMWILIGLVFVAALISGVSVTTVVLVALAALLILILGFQGLIGLLGGLMLLFKIAEEHSSMMWLVALGLAASAVIIIDHNWPHLQPKRSTAQGEEARRPVREPERPASLDAAPIAAGKSKDQVAAHDLRPPIPDFSQPAVREAAIVEIPSMAVPTTVEDAQKLARESGEFIEPRDHQDTWPLEDDHEAPRARGGMRTVALGARSLFFLPGRADDE